MPRKSLILAGLLLAGCASAPRIERPQSLTVRLMVSPRTTFHPVAYARLYVSDPLMELICPAFSVLWGDDTESTWEGSCDPEVRAYAYVEPRDGPRRHYYPGAGEYVIRGRVTGQGVRREAAQVVTVIGRGVEED